MARAKTTDRAEARRRFRAAQLAEDAEIRAAEAARAEPPPAEQPLPNRLSRGAVIANRLGVRRAPSPSTPPAPRPAAPSARPTAGPARPVTTAAPAAGARVGIVDSFRLASGPADIRGDVAAFPSVARHSHAVWLPVAVVVATGLAYLVPSLRQNSIVVFLVQALLAPPAMIPSFLAGMLTRRASWLAGAVAGLASGIMAVVIILIVPLSGAAQVTTSATDALWIVVVGPLFGAAVGAFAGFYRRFLAYSSPNRGQQTRRKAAAKRR